MRDEHSSQCLHANLANTDSRDCHLEQPHRAYIPMKNREMVTNLSNVFHIADDILVVGYDNDGKDHDNTLQKLLQICRQVN